MDKKESIVKFFKDNKQLSYSLLLMIVIPSIFIFNNWFFTNSLKNSLEQNLQNKGVEIGQSVNAALYEKLDDPAKIQEFIDNWEVFNSAENSFDIFYKEGDSFKLVASSNKDNIGNTFEMGRDTENQDLSFNIANFYGWAWNENHPYCMKIMDKDGQSYWLNINILKDINGEKKALMAMATSNKLFESAVNLSIINSYIILFFTLVVIGLLLLGNSKLFEYTVLYNKIKEVDEMKDEFISMASHELRTPVTVIRGYVSMILDDGRSLDPEVKEYLGTIKLSTERLNALIEDLLNVSRIEQGRMKVSLEELHGYEIIGQTAKEFEVQAKEKGLDMRYNLIEGSDDLINIDKDKFKQVLINIIGNAIKYTQSGSVGIEAKNHNGNLVVTVKDTGIGMTAKEREHLFEKFYRVKNDKTQEIIGTGLGLWITKQIVELMGGSIFVDSIEDVGTQFTIEFPLIKKG
ncbi:MAG: Alkaline phosphatase synthesis sensor protein PhoR [Parcubacteria group bacterium ADurb.Bin216]|jgi:signal transduction histidine kinase|nr:MAG: Alkaline phosphatase synthesis sensor protein PhoR [Parcubacteria group bacterium ADurb.Bin216]